MQVISGGTFGKEILLLEREAIFCPKSRGFRVILTEVGVTGLITMPLHQEFALNDGEYLIVSNHSEHCIKVMDSEGNLYDKLGT